MAKNKSFNFQSLIPKPEDSAPASIPAPKDIGATPSVTDHAPKETKHVEIKKLEKITSDSQPKIEGQLAMQPNQKKRKDKRVNFLVNETEYIEFTKINKQLGYSNNEMISHLISEYIKSNKM